MTAFTTQLRPTDIYFALSSVTEEKATALSSESAQDEVAELLAKEHYCCDRATD